MECSCNSPLPTDTPFFGTLPRCRNCGGDVRPGEYRVAKGFTLVVEANGEWWYDEPQPRQQIRKMRTYDE